MNTSLDAAHQAAAARVKRSRRRPPRHAIGAAILISLLAPAAIGAASPATGETRLEVTLYAAPGAPPGPPWSIDCASPGGTPSTIAACRRLGTPRAARLLSAPLGRGQCADEWGGPQTLVIRGTLSGQRIRLTLDRSTTCAIARWKGIEGLLGVSFTA
jgi:hypothetical protein